MESIQNNQTIKTLFKKTLSGLKKIDFRIKSGISGEGKLQRKDYIVITIDEILSVVEKDGWKLCRNNGKVYFFNCTHWIEADREELQSFFGKAAETIGVPKSDARFYQFRLDLVKQFDCAAYLPTPERTDSQPSLNCLNGTLKISEGQKVLCPHNPEDFKTYVLPFNYDPSAIAPMFTQFLNRVLPDKERQMVLQEYLGYVFVSSKKLKLEKVLLLYGSGKNGKSVFIETMSALLGKDNVTHYSLEAITDPRTYVGAELDGKLINLCAEISGKMDAAGFKTLASGEGYHVRRIFAAPFIMENYAKLLFSTNELPKQVEDTNGFFRRWIIIPFDETITEQEQDNELASKIIASELSGVLNWVIQGLDRLLLQKRFTDCEAVRDQVKAFRTQSDSVLMFLEENGYQPDNVDWKPLKDIYIVYQRFCLENGFHQCSIMTFSTRLKNVGYAAKRTNLGKVVYCKISST